MAAHKDPQAKVAFLYTNLYRLHLKAQTQETTTHASTGTFSEAAKTQWRADATAYQAPELRAKSPVRSGLDRALQDLEEVESRMRFLLEELERALGKPKKLSE